MTVLLAVAAAVRCLVFVLYEHRLGDHMWSDMGVYELRAQHLLQHHFDGWDTFTPVGYPALVALTYRLFGKAPDVVGVWQAFMAGATVACTHRIAFRLAGALPALAAGVLCAFHFPLMYYSGLMLSETTFQFLLVLWVAVVVRFAHRGGGASTLVLAGVVLGAGVVVRPNALAIMLLAPISLWAISRHRWRAAARWTGLLAAGAAPLIAAACLHNSRILEHPAGVATNGGLNFYLNFSELRLIHYRRGQRVDTIAPLPNLARYHREGWTNHPFYEDGYFYREGLHEIRKHPVRLFRAFDNFREAAGVGRQTYWPTWQGHDRFEQMVIRAFFWWGIVPGIAYAAYLVASRRVFRPERAGELVILLCVVSLACAVWLFLGDPRMRVPFDPLLIVLSVVGATRIVVGIEQRWRRS